MKRFSLIVPLSVLSMTIAGAQTQPNERWVGAWASAQQRFDPSIAPPAPGLAHATLRQVIRTSIAGRRLRVRFANDFGTSPLRVAAARVARSIGRDAIDLATNVALTFDGESSATVAAGTSTCSDPIDLDVPALVDLAITMRLDDVDAASITTHPGARCTSYAVPGDATSAASLPNAIKSEHWYFLSGVDVVATTDDAAAIVAIGDSITDGRGTTTDGNGRWTDALARRLQSEAATRGVAVLNAGIGGNRVLHDGLGPSARSRFDRDVLAATGARWAILFEGVNDLGTAPPDRVDAVARELIAAYQRMIARAHARGLKVIGGTITPFGGSQYDTPAHESARHTVNTWIRDAHEFDAVVDFDAAVRDGARLRDAFDGGDHLHLNDAGYRALADAIDLTFFTADGSHP